MKNIFITLVTLIGFIFPQDCEEPINVWFKISNDSKTYGQVIQLDMSKGYAGADGQYLYLYVADLTNNEGIVIMFPIGYWESEKVDKKIPKQEKQKDEFDLDEYLKNNKGKGRLIKTNMKVGE